MAIQHCVVKNTFLDFYSSDASEEEDDQCVPAPPKLGKRTNTDSIVRYGTGGRTILDDEDSAGLQVEVSSGHCSSTGGKEEEREEEEEDGGSTSVSNEGSSAGNEVPCRPKSKPEVCQADEAKPTAAQLAEAARLAACGQALQWEAAVPPYACFTVPVLMLGQWPVAEAEWSQASSPDFSHSAACEAQLPAPGPFGALCALSSGMPAKGQKQKAKLPTTQPARHGCGSTARRTTAAEAAAVEGEGSAFEDENVVSDEEAAREGFSTVMLRNLPNDLNRPMLEKLLDAQGLAERYDFCYMPADFRRRCGLGYAFLNLLSHEDAMAAKKALEGFKAWDVEGSSKVLSVCWGKCQGLLANTERYRNSPVMHPLVDDNFRPATYSEGRRVPFPESTKTVRKPRAKRGDPRMPIPAAACAMEEVA